MKLFAGQIWEVVDEKGVACYTRDGLNVLGIGSRLILTKTTIDFDPAIDYVWCRALLWGQELSVASVDLLESCKWLA